MLRMSHKSIQVHTRPSRLYKSRYITKSTGIDWNTITQESFYIGKSITLFTMFYCSMNWLMYKRTREDLEKKDNSKDSKDSKKKK